MSRKKEKRLWKRLKKLRKKYRWQLKTATYYAGIANDYGDLWFSNIKRTGHNLLKASMKMIALERLIKKIEKKLGVRV